MTASQIIDNFIKAHSSNTGDDLRDTRDALNVALAKLDISEWALSVKKEETEPENWQEKSLRYIQQTGEENNRLLATKIIADWSGETSGVLLEALKGLMEVVEYNTNPELIGVYTKNVEAARAAIDQAETFKDIAEKEKAATERKIYQKVEEWADQNGYFMHGTGMEAVLIPIMENLARRMGWEGQENCSVPEVTAFLNAITICKGGPAAGMIRVLEPANAREEAARIAGKAAEAAREMHIALIEILSEARSLYNRPRKLIAACQKGYRALETYSAICQESENACDLPLEEWAKESGDTPAIGGETETEIWPPLPI